MKVFKSAVASSVPYDNTTSGYGTGDVQTAIDAIAVAIAGGVVNYKITSSVVFTTTSTTDVVITGFTVTPVSGTYAVWFNAASFVTKTPYTHNWSIYRAGVKVTDSARSQDTAHSNQNMADSTMTTVVCTGAEAIDVRVNVQNTGSLSINQRTLLLIRLGP